jgi:hypothetical protein
MVLKMPETIKTENLKILDANLKREIAELKHSNDLLKSEKKIVRMLELSYFTL